MLTTDKILAHKTHGKNLILLTQVESSYFFVVAQVVATKSIFSRKNSRGQLKAIFQRQLSESEAFAIFNELTGTHTTSHNTTPEPLLLSDDTKAIETTLSNNEAIVLLLEGKTEKIEIVLESTQPQPVVSPYFPTKEIFLSVQKTRAPAIA